MLMNWVGWWRDGRGGGLPHLLLPIILPAPPPLYAATYWGPAVDGVFWLWN
jgi:hypothetical protein